MGQERRCSNACFAPIIAIPGTSTDFKSSHSHLLSRFKSGLERLAFRRDHSSWFYTPLTGRNPLVCLVAAHNNALLNTSSFDSVTLNQPPTLAYISNYNLIAGALLVFTNSASDPDVPVQTITYNQINSPVGAALNTNTGGFNWRPAVAQSPSTQTVSVVVSDNGVPAMSATQNFSIVVSQPAPPVLGSASNTNGQFGFWVNGDVGPDYFIQVSTNLANWSALATVSAPVPPFFFDGP